MWSDAFLYPLNIYNDLSDGYAVDSNCHVDFFGTHPPPSTASEGRHVGDTHPTVPPREERTGRIKRLTMIRMFVYAVFLN